MTDLVDKPNSGDKPEIDKPESKTLLLDKEKYLNVLANELHKPVRKKFERQRVYATGKNDIWSIDLVDMKEFAEVNDDNKYMLTAVDVFSRYAWVEPLKNKGSDAVFKVFMNIVAKGGTPKKLWTDKGSEFYNSRFKTWMRKTGTVLYSTYGESKSVIVERFNRTLKTMMWRMFTANNSRVWVDFLEDLVNKYNNTEHRTLKMTPAQARLEKNFKKVYERTGPPPIENESKLKQKLRKNLDYLPFKIGDRVRISRQKGIFEKGFHPGWSAEQYSVSEIQQSVDLKQPALYKLIDYNHEEIEGTFYAEELQRIDPSAVDVYLVDKILKTKTIGGKKMALVSWVGMDSSNDSWIELDQTVKLDKNKRKLTKKI